MIISTAKGDSNMPKSGFVRIVAVRNYQCLWARNAVIAANFPTWALDA